MRSIKIKFPPAEYELLEKAVERFNSQSSYLADVKLKRYKHHQTLMIPVAEAPLFVELFCKELPLFTRERIRRDLIVGLLQILKKDPASHVTQNALEQLSSLIF